MNALNRLYSLSKISYWIIFLVYVPSICLGKIAWLAFFHNNAYTLR